MAMTMTVEFLELELLKLSCRLQREREIHSRPIQAQRPLPPPLLFPYSRPLPSEAHLEISFTPENNIHTRQHRVSPPLPVPVGRVRTCVPQFQGQGSPHPTPYPVSSTSPSTALTTPHTQCFRSPVSSSSGALPPPPRPAQPSTK